MSMDTFVITPDVDMHAVEIRIADARASGLTPVLKFRKKRGPKFRQHGATQVRLREMLQANPNLCMERTLADIGAELGVSRERIRQLLPVPPRPRQALHAERVLAERSRQLAAFIEAHPEAVLSKSRGGMTFVEIAAALGWPAYGGREVVSRIWRECDYPDRSLLTWTDRNEQHRELYAKSPERRAYYREYKARWKAEHPQRARELQYRAKFNYEHRTVGEAVCDECGRTFPYARAKQREMVRAGYKVCGRVCGWRRARRLREAPPSSGVQLTPLEQAVLGLTRN